jgi:Cu(I)/Ag(I) efflux system membrane fusion protein
MGRIDRLYVNATGVPVRKGDHLAEIYSPDLIAAQQELLSAANALSAPAFNANPANTFRETLTATKEKLRLLGFSETDIDAVLSKKAPSDHMTMRSSQGGIVLEKMAVEGAYIEAGMPVYLIADLSMVWVKLDAYESDIAWLKPGQKVDFTVEAWPGEAFSGVIHLIDPVIDPMTRTVKVRVEAPNSGNRLKPEMMVRAIVRVDVSASGKVLGKNLRGKWMCPMHPNIVKSGAGTCDICAMPLEPAESLGYGTSGLEHIDPLVIPATAPLITGERAIVYVQVDSSDQVIYEGREVVLGPRAGDYYVVKSGLAEGEKVVVNGVFQIDSELQIRAKKSMMNPGGGGLAQTGHAGHGGSTALAVVAQPDMESKATPVPVSPSMIKKLAPIFIAYFESADNLSRDDLSSVKKSLEALSVAIDKAESDKSNDAMWKSITAGLGDALLHRRHIESLADARGIFEKASAQIIRLAKMYPGAAQETRYIAFCPMAFDGKGAYWLQKHDVIANPYFGPAMLKCGEIKEIITNPSGKGDASNVND